MPRRWIAHLDMDAFYASVELLRYPELRGRAVVVGGRRAHMPVLGADGTREFSVLRDYVGRGVATTASYEARKLGVHSAMGLMKAAALAPEAVLLPADFDQYRRLSRQFKAAVAAIAPRIEDRGIDEIYIDLTELVDPEDARASAEGLARRIKAAVREATGLTCSMGVTPNKLLSKLCSEFGKPDGLTLLDHEDIPARIWPLPVKSVNGIGPKAAARLAALGVNTIGELANFDALRLVDEFGANYAEWLHAAAHGRDQREVVTHSEPKSISRETTFERDLHPRRDREELGGILTQLCAQLAGDLERKRYFARTIGVKLRFDDFKIVTRVLTVPAHVRDAAAIRLWAGRCLKKAPLERRLRLLGVKADNLCREDKLPGAQPGAAAGQAQLGLEFS